MFVVYEHHPCSLAFLEKLLKEHIKEQCHQFFFTFYSFAQKTTVYLVLTYFNRLTRFRKLLRFHKYIQITKFENYLSADTHFQPQVTPQILYFLRVAIFFLLIAPLKSVRGHQNFSVDVRIVIVVSAQSTTILLVVLIVNYYAASVVSYHCSVTPAQLFSVKSERSSIPGGE